MSNRFISVDMDTKLDQDLIDEGIAREISGGIQKQRKNLDFKVDDRISISFNGNDKLKSIMTNPVHVTYIKEQTLATEIKEAASLTAAVEISIEDGVSGNFSITKI